MAASPSVATKKRIGHGSAEKKWQPSIKQKRTGSLPPAITIGEFAGVIRDRGGVERACHLPRDALNRPHCLRQFRRQLSKCLCQPVSLDSPFNGWADPGRPKK